MNTLKKTWFGAVACAAALSACATSKPSAQLRAVREQYVTSSKGPAGKLTPTELYDAKASLDKANAEFANKGDTLACQDQAYIAQRKLDLADVKARTELERQKIADAIKAGVVARDNQVLSTQAALASTREQMKAERRETSAAVASTREALNDERRDNSAAMAANREQLNEERRVNTAAMVAKGVELEGQRRESSAAESDLRNANTAQSNELQKAAAQLEVEKAGRLTAEGRLAGAMKDLATVAAIRQEARGLVVTLSGSVLFASGKHTLLNTAMTKLDQVATALMAQDEQKRMTVEGHTDSLGSDATNQPLSLSRAVAVRDYLVSRGVSPERISAVGKGSSNPLVDNKTPENRANNRRVEIIIGS